MGLVQMEQFKKYLTDKEKELELLALVKVMAGDKAACAIMRKLTPSFGEKISKWWKGLDKFTKFKLVFAQFFGLLFLLMWIAKTVGVDGTVGKALMTVITIILYICTAILAVIVGIWFIMKGKPYRDKVKGPSSTGVEFLRKLCESAEDPEEKAAGLAALQMMLMGQEADSHGKEFLRQRATKFYEKVPEAMEALNTLDHIFILQQAGKDAAQEREFDIKVPWPGLDDVWPPTKYKITEAQKAVTTKFKSFFFRASVHPWIKKYAQESGNQHQLLETVEVPLAMIKNNEEEFDALDRLFKGFRPVSICVVFF